MLCAHCGKRFQAQKQVRGRVPAHYVCGGYIDSGASVCDAPRVPVPYLEEAVLDGIQKRLDLVLDRERLRSQLAEAIRTPVPPAELLQGSEQQLTQVRSAHW